MEESRLPSYTEATAEGRADANGDAQSQEEPGQVEKDYSDTMADEPGRVDIDDSIPILANLPMA